MRKLTIVFILIAFIVAGASVKAFGQIEKVAFHFSNGPIVTHSGQGYDEYGKTDVSAIEEGFALAAFSGGSRRNCSLADDFTLETTTHVDSVQFFVYQGGAFAFTPATSASALWIKIYDGAPNAGGKVIWGSFAEDKDVLIRKEMAFVYRAPASNLTAHEGLGDGGFPIVRLTAKIDAEFTPGIYWLEVTALSAIHPNATGSDVCFPPVTKLGEINTGNGLQYNLNEWVELKDPGNQGHGGVPMEIYGYHEKVDCNPPMQVKAAASNFPEWYSVDVTWQAPAGADPEDELSEEVKYNIYRDGIKINDELITALLYTDLVPGAGTYTYGVTTVVRDCESPQTQYTVVIEETPCLTAIRLTDVYMQGFEEGYPFCWSEKCDESLTRWTLVRDTVSEPATAYHGTRKALFQGEGGVTTKFVSSIFDLTGMDAPELIIRHAQKALSGKQDELRVYYKNSEAGEWIQIAEYTAEVADWKEEKIILPNPSATYWIAFEGKGNGGYGVMLDDIVIHEKDGSECTKVRSLSYTKNTPVEEWYNVHLSWDYPEGAVQGDVDKVFDNGPLITHPGAGIGGCDVSLAEENSIKGQGVMQLHGESLTDDFTLESPTHVENLVFYIYDKDADTHSPEFIGKLYVLLYDGNPNEGGNLIWGDNATNRINREKTKFSNILRLTEASMNSYESFIIRTVTDINLTLPAGTYWVEIQGWSSSDPSQKGQLYVPPVTILGEPTNGNALKREMGPYQPWVTAKEHCEVPFEVHGKRLPMTYDIYRDGTKIAGNVAPNFYTDVAPGAGSYEYCVKAAWDTGCVSDEVCITVTMSADPCETPISDFPYFEDFEGTKESTPAVVDCWRYEYVDNGSFGNPWPWEMTPASVSQPNTAHSGKLKLIYLAAGGSVTKYVMPMFDLSKLENPILNFWHAQAQYNNSEQELRVYYKNRKDAEWTLIHRFEEVISDWQEDTFALPEPSSTYWIAFEGYCKMGRGVMLDDVSVKDDPSFVETPIDVAVAVDDSEGVCKAAITWESRIAGYKFKVYRDNVEIATDITGTSYTDTDFSSGNHEWCVVAVNGSVESEKACKSGTCTLVGIDGLLFNELKVFPNPTTGKINISAEATMKNIRVFDVTGRLVHEIDNINSTETAINVTEFADGIYFINVDGQIKKILKQ